MNLHQGGLHGSLVPRRYRFDIRYNVGRFCFEEYEEAIASDVFRHHLPDSFSKLINDVVDNTIPN